MPARKGTVGPLPQFDEELTAEQLQAKFDKPDDSPPQSARIGPPPRRATRGSSGPAGPSPSGRSATPKEPIPDVFGGDRTGNKTKLEKGLIKFYGTAGALMVMFDPVCGSALIQDADRMAYAMTQYAETNPAVKKALMGLVESSAIGLVFAAHAPVILTIAAHHTPLPKVIAKRANKINADGNWDTDAGTFAINMMIANLRSQTMVEEDD